MSEAGSAGIRPRLAKAAGEIQQHLFSELAPFWLSHGVDAEHGGFLTYFDARGRPTGETLKTLVCQTRMIYSFSAAHRNQLGDGRFLDRAQQGVEFLFAHFWDDDHTGWFWTCQGDGTPENRSKLTYGQSFAIYALSEYAMASGDPRAVEMAEETFRSVTTLAADGDHGGFREFMEADWRPKAPGVYGGDRKSLDVHMHLMEAFTNLYEATGNDAYRDDVAYMVQLIERRMLHPESGTGIAQFAMDWTPRRAILFRDVWGSDRDVEDDAGRPLDNTSYGHNVEFAWLLHHTLKTCGTDVAPHRDTLEKLYRHAVAYGIDWERGGVYCEGPHAGPARERNKEFWQQAETMVAMLDAFELLDDPVFLDAYENVHRFAMDHVINHRVGEWYPLFDEENRRIWDYLGHAWKINYHTMRAAMECEKRLGRLLAKLDISTR